VSVCLVCSDVLFDAVDNVTSIDVDDVNIYWIAGGKVSFKCVSLKHLRASRTVFAEFHAFTNVPLGFLKLSCLI